MQAAALERLSLSLDPGPPAVLPESTVSSAQRELTDG